MQGGFLAAELAQDGYSSSGQAIEAKRGWANVVGATKSDTPASLEKWLGMDTQSQEFGLASKSTGRWEMLRNSFKPYPCGIVIHPVIDGCSQLHDELQNLGLSVKDIQSVHAKVHSLVLELTGKRKPKDGLEGKFSVFHGGAIGLIFGKGTPSQYEDRVVLDEEVVGVRDKIHCKADQGIAADEARIVVLMGNGKVLERHVVHAVGSFEVPMDGEMLKRKFEEQCQAVLGEGVREVSKRFWNIQGFENIADVSRWV